MGGGEKHFLASWRWFLSWHLKQDPAEIEKKLNNKFANTGKPFDAYGFYKAVMVGPVPSRNPC